MKKKYRLLYLILAVFIVLALVACGNGGSSNPSSGGNTPAPGGNSPAPGGSSPAPGGSSPAPGGNSPAPGGNSPAPDNTVYDFKWAEADSAGSGVAQVIDAWIEYVSQASNGRIKITAFYGGILGTNAEQLNMLETGSIDFAICGTGQIPGRYPFAQVFNIPSLKYETSYQVAQAFEYMHQTNDNMAKEIETVKVIGYRANGFTPLAHTGAPFTTVADMKGRLINVSSTAVAAYCESLGMIGVNVPLPQRYEALSKNTINAMTAEWLAMNSYSLYEVIDSIMDVHMTIQQNYVGMSWNAWNSLPADLQDILMECGKRLAADFSVVFTDATQIGKDLCAKNNVTIYEPNAEIKAALAVAEEAGLKAYITDLESKFDVDGAAYVAEAQAALDRFKP